MVYTYRSFASDVLKGLTFFLDLRLLFVFVLIFLSIFVFNYLGLFALFGLTPHLSLSSARAMQNPAGADIGLLLFVVSVFIVIFLLELELYVKQDQAKHKSISSMLRTAVVNYPEFIIATFFQYLVMIGGLILFVVPGLILGPLYEFISTSTIVDNAAFFKAAEASSSAAKSDFVKSLILLLLFLAIGFVFLYVLMIALGGVGLLYRYIIGSLLLSYLLVAFTATSFEVFYSLNIASGGSKKKLVINPN